MKRHQLDKILTTMLRSYNEVSDLNFTVDKQLQVESAGQLLPVKTDPPMGKLTPFQTETIALTLINGDRRLTKMLLSEGSCDLVLSACGKGPIPS